MSQDFDEIHELIAALKAIEVTAREREDLRLLYEKPHGFSFVRDARERPQGRTIRSSSTVGSKLKRALDVKTGDGMMRVGYVANGHWRMRETFRAALQALGWFGKAVQGVEDAEPDQAQRNEIELLKVLEDESLSPRERERLIIARMGQGMYRQRVSLVEPACRVTGVSDPRFLRASHIKPWRFSNNTEKVDGVNGLMLSHHVDHLFDQGFITFGDDGMMVVSPALPPAVASAWALVQAVPARPFSRGQAHYLEFHRLNIFVARDLPA